MKKRLFIRGCRSNAGAALQLILRSDGVAGFNELNLKDWTGWRKRFTSERCASLQRAGRGLRAAPKATPRLEPGPIGLRFERRCDPSRLRAGS
jgi:hypothetical protein